MSRDQFNQYDAERLPLNNPSHGHFSDPRNHKTPEFLSEFRGFALYQYGGEGGIRTKQLSSPDSPCLLALN
ncbi:hypothetical protein [Pseudomonas syringae]|uniref:hypothetical protein n=1 Tax=Pseudomonas syringae TaxID=317 RepID=UPI0011C4A36B|nr:hypothetical protein [Pseudomonas syringae]